MKGAKHGTMKRYGKVGGDGGRGRGEQRNRQSETKRGTGDNGGKWIRPPIPHPLTRLQLALPIFGVDMVHSSTGRILVFRGRNISAAGRIPCYDGMSGPCSLPYLRTGYIVSPMVCRLCVVENITIGICV